MGKKKKMKMEMEEEINNVIKLEYFKIFNYVLFFLKKNIILKYILILN